LTRAEFQADIHIRAFSEWVGYQCDCETAWRHTYVNRRDGVRWTCANLADAFHQYEWNRKSWSETFVELMGYRQRLRKAVADRNGEATFEACEAVLRWGGVWAKNGRTLEVRRTALLDELRHMSAVLTSEHTPAKSDMSFGGIECSMNAGFVKIYSVLLDSCVIYDGRVGAALGLLARQYCEGRRLEGVPPPLAFAFGAPKEAINAQQPKLRNPSRGFFRFPRLRQDSRFHAEQTMRANWFLESALACRPDVFSSGEVGFHELAAGLFMVGYDLTEA
jgi:hypothetical protein